MDVAAQQHSQRHATDNRTVQLDGTRLIELRRQRALSREQLADLAVGPHCLSEATLKRAESGAKVYLETARRIAGLLDVSLDAILVDAPRVATASDVTELTERLPVGVAVLPFEAVGSDRRSAMLARGLTEDVTTRLGHWWFPVICSATTAQVAQDMDATGSAKALDVGYVVVGSVQLRGQSVRVQARLLTPTDGVQIWAEELNRPYSKLFSLQDELTSGIVNSIRDRLVLLSEQRLAFRDPTDMTAWELAVRGCALFRECTAASNRTARELLRRALDRDQDFPWAHYLLALTYQRAVVNHWDDDPRGALAQLSEISRVFECRHPGDSRAKVVSGYVMIFEGDRAGAVEQLEEALMLGPNNHLAYSLLGQAMAMDNEPESALEQFELAIRLSPHDHDLWSLQTGIALTHFVAEDYGKALRWASAASRLRPEMSLTTVTIAAAAALGGDLDTARKAVADLQRRHPPLQLDSFAISMASTQPSIAKRFIDGLSRAGLPAKLP